MSHTTIRTSWAGYTGDYPALPVRHRLTGEICQAHWVGLDRRQRSLYLAGPDWDPVLPCRTNRRGEWVSSPEVETLHQLRCRLRQFARRVTIRYDPVPDPAVPWRLDRGETEQRFATVEELAEAVEEYLAQPAGSALYNTTVGGS